MNFSGTYLLNVALHASVLSVFASLLLAFLRQPGQRSFIAIAGLLVMGFLPWITALRPAPTPRVLPPVTELQAAPSPAELPIWTIVTVPVKNEVIEPFTPPATAEKKLELPDFLTSLLVLWVTGTGIGLTLFTLAFLKVRLWKKSLAHLDDAAWHRLRDFTPSHLAKNDFLICPTDASPCVIGFLRPKIVIPSFLLDQLSEEKLRWAIRHEISHREAGDSRWMVLFTLIRCMNWWNPLTHHLVAIWAGAREQLCDLHATSLADNRADYAEFLITMARKITKQPPLAVTMAKRLHARRLKQRIVSLLDSKTDGLKPIGKGFVSISSGLFFVVSVLVSVLKIRAEDIPIALASSKSEVTSEPKEQARSKETPPPTTAPQPPPIRKTEPKDGEQAAPQVKISTKLLLTRYETGFIEKIPDGGRFTILSMFSEGQEQMIMRGFARERETMLLVTPSITARSDLKVSVESIRKVMETPEQIAKRKPDTGVPVVGLAQKIVARFSDDSPAIELKLDIDYRFIPGSPGLMNDSQRKPLEGLNPDKIKIVKKTISGLLYSGYTVAMDLGEIEPGKYLTVLTRTEILDATGRPIDFQKLIEDRESIIVNKRRADEGTLPLPEITGSLRLNATLVDLPLDQPRPPGDGLVIGLTPTSKIVADRIEKMPEGKVRKLDTIEIPLNQRITPWPEFPGLNLTALASGNHKVVSLTSHATGSGEEEFPNTWEQAPGDVMNFGIRTVDKSVERRLLITLEEVK